VKDADAVFELPSIAETVYVPEAATGILKDALSKFPVASELPVATCAPLNVILTLELAAKPVPVIVTGFPEDPVVLLKLIFGITVSVAVAVDDPGPAAVIKWIPAIAAGIVIVVVQLAAVAVTVDNNVLSK